MELDIAASNVREPSQIQYRRDLSLVTVLRKGANDWSSIRQDIVQKLSPLYFCYGMPVKSLLFHIF
jgi:hypothetical protein